MRVYEFAKEHGLENKDVLAKLKKAGYEVKSHMSVLTPDAVAYLKNEKKPTQEKKQAQPEKPIQIQKQQPQKTTSAPAIKEPEQTPSRELTLEPTILSDVARILQLPFTDVILTLLKWGIVSSKNQLLTVEQIERLAEYYQVPTKAPVRVTAVNAFKKEEKGEMHADSMQSRAPIVVVMGHVDHGKTTLLDYIRQTRVAAREKGGITQHLGAYQAQTSHGNVVFLDTPGHEAFPKIRARGTKVADLAILVVAADDGIMPQTIEAIKHAQSMDVPLVVAINKIDKANQTQIETVKRELAQQYNLLPEEWGGDVVFVPISAKTGLNVDKLLEMVTLQAELMELQTDFSGHAKGYVLEAKLEKGRGAVATFIGQRGTLRLGDYFVCGNATGRVTSLTDSFGKNVKSVSPSFPVLVGGFDQLPEAGDYFQVVTKQQYLKARSLGVEKVMPAARSITAQDALTLIVKTDTNSSKEAVVESIEKLNKKLEKEFVVLHSGIGSITESDIMRAADTQSRIISLHVKTESNAATLASRLGVSIESFDIIYKLLEFLEELSNKSKEAKLVRVKTGEAVVRKVFDIKGLGVIAGCYVRDGVFSRDGFVVVLRGNQKVGEGKIKSLQRERKTVKDVHAGYECGFMVDGFNDFAVDDKVECFVTRAEK